jgi:hypothetical protein
VTEPAARIRKGPHAGDYEVAGRRVYGFSKTKAHKFSKGLEIHKLGEVALGLANKANGGDLLWVKEIVMADDPTRKARGIGMKLAEYRKEKADLGTEAHRAIEQVEMGAAVSEQPGHLRPWVEGYLACKAEVGFRVLGCEQTIINLSVGYGGTADLLPIVVPGVGPAVGDNKTGVVYPDVAIQLAAYAHGEHLIVDDALADMPKVSLETGFVLDVKEHGTTLRAVHLEPAWAAWLACVDLRRWTDDDEPHVLSEPLTGRHAERVAWVAGRLAAITALGREHPIVEQLARSWPDGVPGPKRSDEWTGDHVDRLARLLDAAEAAAETPFGAPDPAASLTLPWGQPDQRTLDGLIARLAALPDDIARRVQVQAKGGDLPVPNLRKGPAHVTRGHVDKLVGLLAEAEADLAQRRQTALALVDGMRCSEAEAAQRAGGDLARLTAAQLDVLRALSTAVVDGLVAANGDGRLVTTSKAAAALIDRRGDEAACLAALGDRAPTSLSALCADPTLVALAWAAGTTNQPTKETNAA